MKKITYYLSFKKNKITYSLLLILSFILLVLLLIYHSYKKLTQKTLYVGCLYSKTGVLGEASYDNYKILVDSFKYSVNKYDAGMLNIVPIYKDLGDDLENFSKWVGDYGWDWVEDILNNSNSVDASFTIIHVSKD